MLDKLVPVAFPTKHRPELRFFKAPLPGQDELIPLTRCPKKVFMFAARGSGLLFAVMGAGVTMPMSQGSGSYVEKDCPLYLYWDTKPGAVLEDTLMVRCTSDDFNAFNFCGFSNPLLQTKAEGAQALHKCGGCRHVRYCSREALAATTTCESTTTA